MVNTRTTITVFIACPSFKTPGIWLTTRTVGPSKNMNIMRNGLVSVGDPMLRNFTHEMANHLRRRRTAARHAKHAPGSVASVTKA